MNIIDREGYGKLFNCSSSDQIGSPVRLVSANTVTTADASDQTRSLVIGFIHSKPSSTTCLITDSLYYSAASGFSGFSGANSGTGVGSPVYLTNASGFSGRPGSNTKLIGEAISPREAILRADPVTSITGLPIGKNRVINGDMRISQREPAASGATAVTGTYMTDRFRTELLYDGTPTWTLDPDVPTAAEAGYVFNKSLKFISTQDSTIVPSQFIWLWQKIEGHNVADIIGNGYNNGLTISFWVKSSITGTYCVAISNSGRDRNYTAEYIINTANTWEKKTITITSSPPSGGTWNNTTGVGIQLHWILSCGTTYNTGTNGTWNSGGAVVSTPNQVNFASGVTNNFWLTGVQLEAGTIATPFEFRNADSEYMLCQRYCQVLAGANYNNGFYAGGAYTGIPSYKYGNNFGMECWYKLSRPLRTASAAISHNITGMTSGGGATGTTLAALNASIAVPAHFTMSGTFSLSAAMYSSDCLYLYPNLSASWSGSAGDIGYLMLGPDVKIIINGEI